jgi:hypothetical protein
VKNDFGSKKIAKRSGRRAKGVFKEMQERGITAGAFNLLCDLISASLDKISGIPDTPDTRVPRIPQIHSGTSRNAFVSMLMGNTGAMELSKGMACEVVLSPFGHPGYPG